MHEQHLEVAGLANARDLGSLKRTDGTLTPSGVFIRSEALDLVTTAGWGELRARGVTTVIDLRRPEERTAEVPEDLDLVTVDLDGDEREFWMPLEEDGRWGTPLYYSSHLSDLPHRMKSALDAIAEARDGAVLFHCGAGWDRTGFLAALLLRAIGVTTEDATADYLRSFENAAAMEALRARSSDLDERLGVLGRFGHTPESAFRSVYDGLTLDAWFASADIGSTTLAAIRTWRGSVIPSEELQR